MAQFGPLNSEEIAWENNLLQKNMKLSDFYHRFIMKDAESRRKGISLNKYGFWDRILLFLFGCLLFHK